MIKKNQRNYASAQEYIAPFMKRYRRVFWFDAFLAFLHLPLLAYMLITQPVIANMFHVDWQTSAVHISIAGLGLIANALLLREVYLSTVGAYLKIIAIMAIYGLVFFSFSKSTGASFFGIIETTFPFILILLAYQGFYGGCVFLYSKWKNQLIENSDNQGMDPTESGS